MRVPVALAIVKMLKQLPKEVMMQQLLKLLAEVCSLSRQGAADEKHTKLTLCKMVEEEQSTFTVITC